MKTITVNEPQAMDTETGDTPDKISHPVWLRLCHWSLVVAIFVMVTSGWQIYNASPIWRQYPTFSHSITLGGWLGGALMWHFAGMWLLVATGLFYLFMNIVTGRMKRKFFPVSIHEFFEDIWQTLKLKLHHDDLTKFNAVQKVAYLFAMVDIIIIILSGLVVYKQVQFPVLRWIMGGYDNARIVHFFGMVGLVGFILVHVTLVIVVPRTLFGMIFGRFYPFGRKKHEAN